MSGSIESGIAVNSVEHQSNPKELHMRIKKAALAVTMLMAATTASVLVPASSASAMDEVPCGNRTDLVKIHWYHPDAGAVWKCFANDGRGVRPTEGVRTMEIRTGNNDIYWWANGKRHLLTRGKTSPWPKGHSVRVTQIRILSCKNPDATC
ncbi:hypothetical protein ACIBL8_46965 [Streptomyces sp. NPDC050523]|uniref:hypothetical protein n=1 Tax=Streptomyces sp. NPDC050523 TaxID=3365622 RepID=UPI0037B1E9B2